MDPRSKHIRRDILLAVKSLFIDNGFDGLSVAEICQKADVSRSAFYAHYRSPDECIAQLLNEEFAPMERSLLESGLDPDSLLLNKRPLSYYLFSHIEENLPLYRPLFTDPRGAVVLEAVRAATESMSYQPQHASDTFSANALQEGTIATERSIRGGVKIFVLL